MFIIYKVLKVRLVFLSMLSIWMVGWLCVFGWKMCCW